jgi:MoaA/NifB/PqqE/SkfB family radical SAM enzyme
MPVSAGSLRSSSFGDLWHGAGVFGDLRDPRLGGRCGACEFSKICGGCRCRAYATYGDYLAEDPAGEIEAFGKTWAFVPFDLWIAEHGEVGSDGH